MASSACVLLMATMAIASTASRVDQLQQLQFGNEGVVFANDTFEYRVSISAVPADHF